MSFDRTQEQQILFDGAKRYMTQSYDFAAQQSRIRGRYSLDAQQWRTFAEMGWLGLQVPEAYGGLGLPSSDLCALMEAFGYGPLLEPYVPTVVLCGRIVTALGTTEQKTSILPALANGDLLLALAHVESQSGHQLSSVRTIARAERSGWRITGQKILSLGGYCADQLIVSARLTGGEEDCQGIGLFLVPIDAPGLVRSSHGLLDGSASSDFALQDVVVPRDALLGASESAYDVLEDAVDHALIALASQAVGSMQALLDATIDYTRSRHQFGRPLSTNQALRHKVAEMAIACQEARAIAARAALHADGPRASKSRATSAAKWKIGVAGRRVAEQAVQFHGGIGMTDEIPVGNYYKSILGFGLLFGSVESHLRRFGRLRLSDALVER